MFDEGKSFDSRMGRHYCTRCGKQATQYPLCEDCWKQHDDAIADRPASESKGEKKVEMTDDPLAGVRRYTVKDICEIPDELVHEKRAILVQEPAVIKAIVECFRNQANAEWEKGDKFSGSESLNLMADRLENKK